MAAPHLAGSTEADRLRDAKAAARARAVAVRAGCDPALGERLAGHVVRDLTLRPGPVAGYWPLDGEIDIRTLLHLLHARGPVLLPVTPRRGQQLVFRHWHPGMALIRERFGTLCPGPEAPEDVPRTLFVPLLAFDRTGRRLGYGGGFYDRTLPMLPDAVAIGCGFAAQELDVVPAGEYDARLSAIATERGVIVAES